MKENNCFELYKILFYKRQLYICENCTNLPIWFSVITLTTLEFRIKHSPFLNRKLFTTTSPKLLKNPEEIKASKKSQIFYQKRCGQKFKRTIKQEIQSFLSIFSVIQEKCNSEKLQERYVCVSFMNLKIIVIFSFASTKKKKGKKKKI